MSTDKCIRAHDLINTPLSHVCAPKCTVARRVRRRVAKNTVCEYSESCFTCPLSDCKQTVVKCLTVNRFADRSSRVTQKAHRNTPVGFCFAGAYCILAVLPCVLQASRGLQHLLVLKPPFTPPSAAPRAGGSLVPVARARHHSRR